MKFRMSLSYKSLINLSFAFLLTACGGGNDSNDSDSSLCASHTLETGEVYQCETESAYDNCSGDNTDCSACTCTDNCNPGGGTDTNNEGDSCAVDGRNVTVPNNSSCTYRGETATCTDGRIQFLFLNSGGTINLNSTINGVFYDASLSCSE